MAVVLELGEYDTFLFDTPGGTTTNNLPAGLKDLEAGIGIGKPIHQIYCLTFGINSAYLLAGRTAHGAIIRRHNLSPLLETWLIDTATNMCRRDISTLTVELGPNNSFFARDKDSYRWHNLPDALEEAIQQRLSPMGWRATPEVILLGADGAYVYANNCGGHSYALGNYPQLQHLIQDLHTQNINGHTGFALLQYISLSTHQPTHFIALHTSGHPIAHLNSQSSHALSSISSTFPTKTLISISPQQQAMISPQTLSPLMMAQPPPHTTPQTTSPPIFQQPAFQPPAYAQSSNPFPQQGAVAARPVVHTLQSAPVPQVGAPVVQQQGRPAAVQKRHSSGFGRHFSNTASGVLSNVIGSEITSGASGMGGDGGNGGGGDGGD